MNDKEYYEFLGKLGELIGHDTKIANELGFDMNVVLDLSSNLKEDSRIGLFSVDRIEAKAELVWQDRICNIRIWKKPGGKDDKLVLYVEDNYNYPNNYQRHDFGKSWNEILKDPELMEYITAVFVEVGMDEAHAKTHPLDELDLFWSDYPREIFIY